MLYRHLSVDKEPLESRLNYREVDKLAASELL